MRRIVIILALVVASSLVGTTLPSSAAGGLAWDQVTKFSMDGTIPEPNFAQDFQTASQPPEEQPQHRGMFGGIQNSINAAMGAMQMFKTGIAERHYVAGSLERVDNVAQQTATITDCNARTITYLNLAKKTYRVVSMDQPQAPQSAPQGRPQPQRERPVQDDNTRMKIAYTSQALGPKQLEGTNTDGYKATMAITVMRPGEAPQTMNTVLTEYVAGYPEPHQTCRSPRMEMGEGPGAGPMANNMQMTQMINEAMRTPSGDPRFTITSNGPALPSGRLDMFMVYQLAGQQSNGRSFATIVERGNVRQVSDTDKSIFGVPPDFTKET